MFKNYDEPAQLCILPCNMPRYKTEIFSSATTGGSMGNVMGSVVKFKDTFYIIHIHIANRKLHDTY